MSIKVGQAFERTSAQPIDTSLALTKADMLAVNDNLMPSYYFTICQDDGAIYLYSKTNTPTITTGKFEKFEGGSGGADIHSTTDTLNDEINGTKTVLAADLPGTSITDLTIGSSIIKDNKGTLGLVTAINGSTDITVTTATTSTPVKELTQAEYDVLSPAVKNNGTIYFITDGETPTHYIGAYDTIYSTTERVIGSYMGKPLYQKTYDLGSVVTVSSTNWYDTGCAFGDTDIVVNCVGQTAQGSSTTQNASFPLLCYAETSSPNFKIMVARDDNGINCRYFTVQYTKATDTTSAVEYATPNDYSTSEKIVGTWVDGKPVYQKTYLLDFSGNVTLGTILATFTGEASNIDKAIDAKINCVSNNGADKDFITYSYDITVRAHGNDILVVGTTTLNNVSNVSVTIQYTKTTD